MKTFEEVFNLRIGNLPKELKMDIIRQYRLNPEDNRIGNFPKNCKIPDEQKHSIFNRFGAVSKASIYIFLLSEEEKTPDLEEKFKIISNQKYPIYRIGTNKTLELTFISYDHDNELLKFFFNVQGRLTPFIDERGNRYLGYPLEDLIVVVRKNPKLIEIRSTKELENTFALEKVQEWLGITSKPTKPDMRKPEFVQPFIDWVDSITAASMILYGRPVGYVKYSGRKAGEVRQNIMQDDWAAKDIVSAISKGNLFSGRVEMLLNKKRINLGINFRKGCFSSAQIYEEETLTTLINEMYKIAIGAREYVPKLDDF